MPTNLLLILMDDMGWRDLACAGSAFYETPVIDGLRRDGVYFTESYAACPVCSPSRASLLTGKYPARLGLTDWIDLDGWYHPCRGKLIDAPYVKRIPDGETTLAQALREGGYQTWHVGKWHLGAKEYYPEHKGFDVNIGGCAWGHPHEGYFSPYHIETLPEGPDGEQLTDRLTDEAMRLLENRDPGRPFFLNLWYYDVHIPIEAKPEDIRYFEGKAARMGLDREEAFAVGEPFPIYAKRGERVTRRLLQSDPVYAAMILNLDRNIGRLLAKLRALGLEKDTLVIFTSDNGGLSTSEGSPTCNAPASEGKGWMYEGGTRVPLIAAWPGRVAPGGVCATPVTSPDLYPTFLEAAGLPPRPAQHRDGQSFLGLLLGGPEPEQPRPLFWHYPHYGNQGGTPGSSVRLGNYKLIEFFEDGRVELYDLAADIGEERDLSAQLPKKRAELLALLHRWQREVRAKFPLPNPEGGAAVDLAGKMG